jgi:Bacteriophage Lambda NinG protein
VQRMPMRKISRKGLIAKVDKAFSRYIRQKHADEYGFVQCVTCGCRMRWEDSQAGHFVRRGHAATRWHPQNVHPQDAACNLYRDGCQDEHAAYIVRTYGEPVLHELLRLKHSEKRWTMAELRELAERYSDA